MTTSGTTNEDSDNEWQQAVILANIFFANKSGTYH